MERLGGPTISLQETPINEHTSYAVPFGGEVNRALNEIYGVSDRLQNCRLDHRNRSRATVQEINQHMANDCWIFMRDELAPLSFSGEL